MATLEHPVVGPRVGHANSKAIFALLLGMFSMACLVALAVFVAIAPNRLDATGGGWLLLPFFAFVGGLIAAFIGSIAWIDVRRGITDRRLFEAQMGAVLGGLAALAVVAAMIVLFVVFLLLMASFGAGPGGID